MTTFSLMNIYLLKLMRTHQACMLVMYCVKKNPKTNLLKVIALLVAGLLVQRPVVLNIKVECQQCHVS